MSTRISSEQVFAEKGGHAYEVMYDGPALGVTRGDWLVVKPAHCVVGDELYVLHSDELVRLQAEPGGLALTRGGGDVETLIPMEAWEVVMGRVATVLRRGMR